MTFSVAAALDRWVERNSPPRPPDGKWHPSSLFSCERQALYEVRAVPPSDERDARSRRVLRVGSEFHRIVQEAVTESDAVRRVYHEVSIDIPELNVAGSSDSLIELAVTELPDGTWEVQEYKSISSKSFRYNDLPKPDHSDQTRAYIYALSRYGGIAGGGVVIPPLGDRLSRGRITYVSKDDLRVESFTVLLTPEWVAKFEAKIARLERYRADGVALPPRLPDQKGKRHWLCASYCVFRSKCWDQDGEGVDLG